MGAQRRVRSRELLGCRAYFGATRRLFQQVPERLVISLSTLQPSPPELAASILLGFSRDGSRLFAYSFDAATRFELLVFELTLAPARGASLIARAPLFETADFPAESALGDLVDGGSVRIALSESADLSLILMTAWLAEGAPRGACTRHVSLLRAPPRARPSTPPATLPAIHISFLSSPPYPRVLPNALESLPAGEHALVINTGASFAYVVVGGCRASRDEPPPRLGPLLRISESAPHGDDGSGRRAFSIRAVHQCDVEHLLSSLIARGPTRDYDARFVRFETQPDSAPLRKHFAQSRAPRALTILVVLDAEACVAGTTGAGVSSNDGRAGENSPGASSASTKSTSSPSPPADAVIFSWENAVARDAPPRVKRTYGSQQRPGAVSASAAVLPAATQLLALPPPPPRPMPRPGALASDVALVRTSVMFSWNACAGTLPRILTFTDLPPALQPGLDDAAGRSLMSVTTAVTSDAAAAVPPERDLRELTNAAFLRGKSLTHLVSPMLPLALVL